MHQPFMNILDGKQKQPESYMLGVKEQNEQQLSADKVLDGHLTQH